MEFLKYQHIVRLGDDLVKGILNGLCHVFHKLDGTNGSIWIREGNICCGSRNRELSLDNDNAGFMGYVLNEPKFALYLEKYPTHRLMGEFLVKHTISGYLPSAWRKFYIFDVMVDGNYLEYGEYIKCLEEFDLEYIPKITTLSNPSEDELGKIETTFLMREGAGEGIVIKNYDFINQFGDKVFAKIIHSEFKNRWRKYPREENEEFALEDNIIDKYITASFIDKEVAKGSTGNPFELIGRIYHEFIVEEIWNILKRFRNPTINFKLLKRKAEHKLRKYIGEYHV